MKFKRSILSLLVAGMFAGAGASVLAQNVTADDQTKAEGDFNKRPGVDEPSTPNSNDNAARDTTGKGSADDQAKAEGDFNKRAGVIEPSTPNSNDNAARDTTGKGSADDQAKAEGDFNKRPGVIEPSTPNSNDRAARDKAEMDYQTAKEQCDSLIGAAKRSCNKDAFAARKEALKQWNGPGAMNETDPSTAGDEKADSGDTGSASNQNQARTN